MTQQRPLGSNPADSTLWPETDDLDVFDRNTGKTESVFERHDEIAAQLFALQHQLIEVVKGEQFPYRRLAERCQTGSEGRFRRQKVSRTTNCEAKLTDQTH